MANRVTPILVVFKTNSYSLGIEDKGSGTAQGAARLPFEHSPLPLLHLSSQLIHGDLDLGNILISPNLQTVFLDFTPGWFPESYAIAVFAWWVGPCRGDPVILKRLKSIPDFDQLLLHVAISKLMVHYEFKKLELEAANDLVTLQTPIKAVIEWFQRSL